MGSRQVTPATKTTKIHVVPSPWRAVVIDGDGWEIGRFGPFDTLTDMVQTVQPAHPDAWFVRADTQETAA